MIRPIRGEQGSTLAFLAIAMVVLLSVAALAIDLGMLYTGKQRAQNVCDEAAMSGAPLLTGQSGCATQSGLPATAAQQTATANNQLSPKWQVCIPNTSTAGVQISFPSGTVQSDSGQSITVALGQAMRVKGSVNVNYGFARIMGFQSHFVNATATVILQPAPSVTSNLFAPLVVADTTIFGSNGQSILKFGQQVTLKTNAWQDNFLGAGNFGPVELPGDGSGASTYRSRLAGDLPALTITSTPITTVSTKPGNMKGPTSQGLSSRLAKETDSRFTNDATAWSNWLNAYNTTTGMFPSTWRIMLVPIVKDPTVPVNGRSTVTIVGCAGFFIESAPKNQPVVGRFLQGVYAGGTIHWIFPTSNSITSTVGIASTHLVS